MCIRDRFMIYIEQKLENTIISITLYKRYVDDILVIAESHEHIRNIVHEFNHVHPNTTATVELENNDEIPFLDILIHRRTNRSIRRSVYRKSTANNQCLNFLSFSPIQHKMSVVRSSYTRAYRMCTSDTLQNDLSEIRKILESDGYPGSFIMKKR